MAEAHVVESRGSMLLIICVRRYQEEGTIVQTVTLVPNSRRLAVVIHGWRSKLLKRHWLLLLLHAFDLMLSLVVDGNVLLGR